MDYKVFEGRVLELFYKTSDRVTAQLAAYKIGTTVEEARAMLEQMATHEVVSMETDDQGGIYFDLISRPPPTGERLSWHMPMHGGHMPPMQMVHQPVLVPYVPVMPVPHMLQEKSVGGAMALSFFFGPFGMLYSTIPGALTMFFAGGLFLVLTLGLGIVFYVPACVLWSALAAQQHNNRVRAQRNYVHLQAMQNMHHMSAASHMQHQRMLPPPRR